MFLQGIGKKDYYPLHYLYWSFYQQPYSGGQTHIFDYYRAETDSDVDMAKHSKPTLMRGLLIRILTPNTQSCRHGSPTGIWVPELINPWEWPYPKQLIS